MKRFVVVGGGWAGLAAAFELCQLCKQHKLSAQIQLFDAAPQLGGRARGLNLTFFEQERQLDNGQHLLIGAYQSCQGLLAKAIEVLKAAGPVAAPTSLYQPLASIYRQAFLLQHPPYAGEELPVADISGHGSDLIPKKGLRFGRIAALDKCLGHLSSLLPQAGTAAGLVFAKGMRLSDKFAFIRLGQHLQRRSFKVNSAQTVAQLMQDTKQPAKLITSLWDPLCVSALNTAIDKACAQAFANVLQDSLFSSDAGNSDYCIPVATLTDYFVTPLAQALKVEGVQIALGTTIKDLRTLSAIDALVLAVPPPQASELLRDEAPAMSKRLAEFEFQSISTVYLAWDHALQIAGKGPILLREEPEKQAYGQWFFDRGFEAGSHIAAIVVSARGRYSDVDNIALASNIGEQVARQLGVPIPKANRVITEKRATFACTPERPHFQTKDLLLQATTNRPFPIALAGDYAYSRYPATLEGAVRSGIDAAKLICNA